MHQVPKENVLRRIALENPWWTAPHKVPETYTKLTPRPYMKLFYPLITNLQVRRAPVLMGPRRVGKTYLLHHCIANLLEDGTPPKHICYVSVDNPTYVNLSLEQLLELYSETTGVAIASTPIFFIFDEIQYLREWERHLKSLVDTFPTVRCIVSGSAAAALRLKSQESGAGRFTDFLLPPLTFYEYLALLGAGELVEYSLRNDNVPTYMSVDTTVLNAHFENYIHFGGYPEVALSPGIQENPERFIKNDIIDKVLLRDLPSLYGISNISELNALFTSLAYNSSQEVSLEELFKHSGVAKPTIMRYIEYLEAAFLIRVVRRVDDRAKYFLRARNFKVYLTNPSLRTALFGSIEPEDPTFGWLVETAVFAQWFHSTGQNLHYARWKKGELDIVSLRGNGGVRWAVEVKWSDRQVKQPVLLNEVIKFCGKNNLGRIIVTSRTRVATTKISNVEINFWPAALYAYAAGHMIINSRIVALEAAQATGSI